MTAVWILLFVCTSSLPSCSQGDVLVANQSYTSSEECYADGAKRARGRSLSALEEGKSKSETNVHSKSDMTPCRRVRNDQLATLKQDGGRRRRPSGCGQFGSRRPQARPPPRART